MTTSRRAARSCCSSALPASARLRSPSRSRAPWAGRTFAFHWAATANFPQSIPGPLLDRLETVTFAGYTEREKLEIAKRYLVPRQLHENGLTPEQLTITDAALSEIITSYTREAGVRQLEREIGKLGRKVARQIAGGEVERVAVDAKDVDDLIGRPRVHPEHKAREDQVGVATGMYYTPV